MKNIVLFGGGNQASYTIDIIEKAGIYNIVGIIDSIKEIGSKCCGYQIIGRQEDITNLMQKYKIDFGIICVGDNWNRSIIYNDIIKQVPKFKFANAIHPSVIIANNVKLGQGIIAMAGCIFNTNSSIEDFTFFATGAQIEHDCFIDKFSSISAGSITGGHVKIGKYVAITLGVIIVDRVEVGNNTIVGSGSLVIKSLPNNVLAYGNPAKIIREISNSEKFLK